MLKKAAFSNAAFLLLFSWSSSFLGLQLCHAFDGTEMVGFLNQRYTPQAPPRDVSLTGISEIDSVRSFLKHGSGRAHGLRTAVLATSGVRQPTVVGDINQPGAVTQMLFYYTGYGVTLCLILLLSLQAWASSRQRKPEVKKKETFNITATEFSAWSRTRL
ncbi:unnamed protein product [Amoebophrya sp. A25]|nr:unnamed protein product [Amoebophrya sp. A25]|eukprot:GSA25T00006865001.1